MSHWADALRVLEFLFFVYVTIAFSSVVLVEVVNPTDDGDEFKEGGENS